MNIFLKFALLSGALLGIITIGCGTSKDIKSKSLCDKTNVFCETMGADKPPQGSAELRIKAHIKTHLEGALHVEFTKSFHGEPEYPFLLNIDGQAVTWKVAGQKENIPEYDKKGRRNPEGGKGMRYILEKKIIVAPGPHWIFFGLPGENYSQEFAVTLKEDHLNVLEFHPIYSTGRMHGQCFENGIRSYKVFFNGVQVN